MKKYAIVYQIPHRPTTADDPKGKPSKCKYCIANPQRTYQCEKNPCYIGPCLRAETRTAIIDVPDDYDPWATMDDFMKNFDYSQFPERKVCNHWIVTVNCGYEVKEK